MFMSNVFIGFVLKVGVYQMVRCIVVANLAISPLLRVPSVRHTLSSGVFRAYVCTRLLRFCKSYCMAYVLPGFRLLFVLSHNRGYRSCSGDSGTYTLHASPSGDRLRQPAELPATRG